MSYSWNDTKKLFETGLERRVSFAARFFSRFLAAALNFLQHLVKFQDGASIKADFVLKMDHVFDIFNSCMISLLYLF